MSGIINKYSDYFSDSIKALLLITALPKLDGQYCVSAAISCPLQKVLPWTKSLIHRRSDTIGTEIIFHTIMPITFIFMEKYNSE